MLPHLWALTLALAPSLVSGALYPKDSLVKMIDTKGFRSAMKENRTSVVAFVASWCGHCKAMVPEYSKAALGLYPLIPTYAVDCDENRALCAEQGVQGFPTVKLFPRGKDAAPILYDAPTRTASSFYYFAIRRVPHKNKKLYRLEQIQPWVNENIDRTRVLLLSKSKNVPLMWQVLANKYRDNFAFANHRDRKGKTSVTLGYQAGSKKESKVLVYPAGSTKPVLFEGLLKYDSISKFFDTVLDGTADLSSANAAAADEIYEPTAEEEEIERQQEAQRIALAHGGFNDMIDFEEAIKKYGTDFHGSHGFGGALGDMPMKGHKKGEKANEKADAEPAKDEEDDGRVEDPIHRILRVQREKAEQKARDALKAAEMPKTGEAGQVVLEARTDAESTHSPTAAAAQASSTPIQEPIAHESPVLDAIVEKEEEDADDDTEEPVFAEEAAPPAASATLETEAAPTPESTTPQETEAHIKDEL
ncbi:hypothetical protein BC834DRAFT_633336 [Gloeopeniophorella convolvens]|nr:hypothetical protein BC834DRAFT_633336 [Gloeopeniophorella convolvens]